MKNLFYRLCLWFGYIPTEHLELRAKLLGYNVRKETAFYLDDEDNYWNVEPDCGIMVDFYSKREALLYVLKTKGA